MSAGLYERVEGEIKEFEVHATLKVELGKYFCEGCRKEFIDIFFKVKL